MKSQTIDRAMLVMPVFVAKPKEGVVRLILFAPNTYMRFLAPRTIIK